MSHREKGLTPWIKNATEPRPAKYRDFTVEQINAEAQRADISDEDKHAICMIRTGHHCTFLSPKMYDDAVRQGCDMANFVKNKPMPITMTSDYHFGTASKQQLKRLASITDKVWLDEYTDYETRHGVHVITHQMPTSAQRRDMITAALDAGLPLGASHVPKWDGEVFAAFSLNGGGNPYAPVRNDLVTDKPALEPITCTKLEPSTRPKWDSCIGKRKNRDSVSCHDCMPGLGGRCTCCAERE